MPRLPGRKSTRKTVPSVEGLEIASFVMHHEEWLWRRPCVIEGCEHRMGPKTDEPGWTAWQDCSQDASPAFVVPHGRYDGPPLGLVCSCHAASIVAGLP